MEILEKVVLSLDNALDLILGGDIQRRADKLTDHHHYPSLYIYR